MRADPLDVVLDQLCRGDVAAAAQVFTAFEPALRAVVRRTLPPRLRTKFDSVDVVQSVWVDLVQGFRAGRWHFAHTGQLKAFLIRATRNRLVDGARHHRRALLGQQSLHPGIADYATAQAGPVELAEAEELWGRMLALCPERHRDIIRLRRQGCTLGEIARQTGLHESSVRRILYELARVLASPCQPVG